jgi:hypothetical protein
MVAATLTPRTTIGLLPARPGIRFVASELVGITAHYVGTNLRVDTPGELRALLRRIQTTDMQGKGYSDVMYNVAIDPFEPGVIELRGVEWRGAANGSGDANRRSPSVLFIQGPASPETSLIEAAGAQYADKLFEAFAGRPLPWFPHSRWRPTSCPGVSVTRHLELFNGRELILPPVFRPGPLEQRPTLSLGGRDTMGDGHVHYLQRVINAAGIEVGVDGIFGDRSVWATMEFQVKFRVPITPADGFVHDTPGVVGLFTWAKVDEVARYLGVG